MAFDVEGALAAGYSQADIADYLAQKNGFDIQGARKAGYDDSDILTHLASKGVTAKEEKKVEPKAAPKQDAVTNPLKPTEPSFLDRLVDSVKQLTTPEPSSVMENVSPTKEQQQKSIDQRLALGQGPISEAAVSKAQDIRAGRLKTSDEGLIRVAQALQQQGAPTLESVAQRVTEDERITADAESARRRAAARENPLLSSLASGTASMAAGGLNLPSVAADAFNQTFINPVLQAAGLQPLGRTPTAYGTEYLGKAAEDYMPAAGKQGMSEAYDKGQFGQWLFSNLAANSPQVAMSLAAAYFPPLRASILPAMGGTAAGQSFAGGDDSRVAVAKGAVEVVTEMLPLGVFDRVGNLFKGMSPAKQKAVLAVAGQRLAQSGAQITADVLTNSIEEAAAEFGGNVLDKYFQGKDVELSQGLADAAVLGGATGGAITLPRAAATLAGANQQLTPEQEIANAINENAQNLQPANTRQAAVRALNPQTYDQTLISPEQTVNRIQQATSVDEAIAIANQLSGTVNVNVPPPPVAEIQQPITNLGRVEPTLAPVTEPAAVNLPQPDVAIEQQFGLDKLRLAPRPQRIQGQAVADLSDDALRTVVQDDTMPAITRRGAQIELDARRTEQGAKRVEPTLESVTPPAAAAGAPLPAAAAGPVAKPAAPATVREDAQGYFDQQAAAENRPSPVQLNESPPEEAKAVAQIAQVLGSQFGGGIETYHDTRDEAVNGFAYKGIAFVNTANVPSNITKTSLHEFKHTVEQIAKAETEMGLTGTRAQQFVADIDSIFDDMTDEGKTAYLVNFLAKDELAGLTGRARDTRLRQLMASPTLRSEMTADFLGNRATDKAFWKDVAAQDPQGFKDFVEKWLKIIDNLLATLRGTKTQGQKESAKVDKYIRDLNVAKMVARDALIAYRRGGLQEAQGVAPQGKAATSLREGEGRETNIPAGGEGVQPTAERAGPPAGEAGRGEIPEYGTAREGAISVVGRHYSPRVQTRLSGRYYGTGLRGAEGSRLRESKDSRISNRVYFYVDTGNGIRPESGVGRFAHEVRLNNIYDPASRIIPPQGNANAFESAVIDAGFDGYIAPFGRGAAVVLLGPKHDAVPVKSLEAGPAFAKRQQAETEEEKAIEPEKDLGTFRSVADAIGLSEAEYKATALGLMTGKTKSEAFETPFVGGIPPVVEWLDKRYRDAGMKPLDLNKAEDRATVAKMMAAEAVAAIKSAGNAVEWYDETVRKTLSIMAVKYPELNTDQNARNAFLIATAISSQTMNVEDNLRYASKQYEAFRQTGEFPEVGTGKSAPAMANNFALANALLKDMGPDLLRRFLQTEVTKRELESMGFSITGESMDEKMLGSAVFGPKIGFGFYSNLSGNFEPVTMDMWFMRTIGRLTGRLPAFDEKLFAKQVAKLRSAIAETGDSSKGLFAADFDQALVDEAMKSDDGAIALARAVNSLHNRQFIKERAKFDSKERYKTNLVGAAGAILKSADKPKDSPSSGGERQRLRDVVRQMVALVEKQTGKRVPPAALQALIWYPEQELYKKLGVKLRVTSQDYAGAAKSLLTKEGFDGKRISAAAKSGSGPARQVAGGKVAGANQTLGAKGKGTGPLEGKEREAFIGPRVEKALIEEANALPLVDVFTNLNKRGIAKTNAEKIVDRRTDAARIKYVQENFLDILSELEDSGKVDINCD